MERVILLTAVDGAPQLARFLKLCGPGLDVVQVATRAELEALPAGLLAGARLIAFGSGVVVPKRTLDGLGFGAYNFHPGSPRYPRGAPHCFAIYERAESFGATAHLMTEKVDAGAIIGTEMFAVPPGITGDELAERATVAMVHLFRRLGTLLTNWPGPLPAIATQWSGTRRRRADLARMRELPAGLSEGERQLRPRAFGTADPDTPTASPAPPPALAPA